MTEIQTPAVLKEALLTALLTCAETDLTNFLARPLTLRAQPLLMSSLKELLDSKRIISRVHCTWFLPFLSKLPPPIAASYFIVFPNTARSLLASSLGTTVPSFSLSPFCQSFLITHLKNFIFEEKILPVPLLTNTLFLPLLSISEPTLGQLTNLLGLHDLSAQIKQIVDNKLLAKIQSSLKPIEQQYLDYCSKQTIRWIPPKLELQKWDGQEASLHALLRERGLVRLAKATLVEEISFRWHLSRCFEVSQGKKLIENYKQSTDKSLIPYFQKQVIELIERLK